jgi:TRAP-type uncharacterized transport system fused permease subunit
MKSFVSFLFGFATFIVVWIFSVAISDLVMGHKKFSSHSGDNPHQGLGVLIAFSLGPICSLLLAGLFGYLFYKVRVRDRLILFGILITLILASTIITLIGA